MRIPFSNGNPNEKKAIKASHNGHSSTACDWKQSSPIILMVNLPVATNLFKISCIGRDLHNTVRSQGNTWTFRLTSLSHPCSKCPVLLGSRLTCFRSASANGEVSKNEGGVKSQNTLLEFKGSKGQARDVDWQPGAVRRFRIRFCVCVVVQEVTVCLSRSLCGWR